MTSMTSSVERTDLDFKISVALIKSVMVGQNSVIQFLISLWLNEFRFPSTVRTIKVMARLVSSHTLILGRLRPAK